MRPFFTAMVTLLVSTHVNAQHAVDLSERPVCKVAPSGIEPEGCVLDAGQLARAEGAIREYLGACESEEIRLNYMREVSDRYLTSLAVSTSNDYSRLLEHAEEGRVAMKAFLTDEPTHKLCGAASRNSIMASFIEREHVVAGLIGGRSPPAPPPLAEEENALPVIDDGTHEAAVPQPDGEQDESY